MFKDKTPKSQKRWAELVGLVSAVSAAIIVGTASWILYEHTTTLLTENLHQRLEAIVKTAAVQFDPKDLERLREESDYKRPEWKKVVNQLIAIRMNNESIVFAYILRKKPNAPDQMEFVADSHSLDPYAKIDLDNNGIIDDADGLNWPGQTYEDVPTEAFDGYQSVTTNKDLYEDQWGILISGYAPIKKESGETVGVMVVDMRVNDFLQITRRTLFPFLIFIGALVIVILGLLDFLTRVLL